MRKICEGGSIMTSTFWLTNQGVGSLSPFQLTRFFHLIGIKVCLIWLIRNCILFICFLRLFDFCLTSLFYSAWALFLIPQFRAWLQLWDLYFSLAEKILWMFSLFTYTTQCFSAFQHRFKFNNLRCWKALLLFPWTNIRDYPSLLTALWGFLLLFSPSCHDISGFSSLVIRSPTWECQSLWGTLLMKQICSGC